MPSKRCDSRLDLKGSSSNFQLKAILSYNQTRRAEMRIPTVIEQKSNRWSYPLRCAQAIHKR